MLSSRVTIYLGKVVRWRVLFVLAIAFISLAASQATTYAVCDIDEATNGLGNYTNGGWEFSIMNLEGSSADLWNYNPNPVWEDSTFWTMVINGNRWAQVGWLESVDLSTGSSPKVFLQIIEDDGGPVTRFYHTDGGGQWTSSASGAVSPASSKKYEVFKYNGTWYFRYDFGSYYNISTDWDPEDVQVMGETTTYEDNYPDTDLGDHFPGDTSNKIQANNSKKNVSGTWYDTSLSLPGSYSGNGRHDLNNSSGDGVRVWDVRCSE